MKHKQSLVYNLIELESNDENIEIFKLPYYRYLWDDRINISNKDLINTSITSPMRIVNCWYQLVLILPPCNTVLKTFQFKIFGLKMVFLYVSWKPSPFQSWDCSFLYLEQSNWLDTSKMATKSQTCQLPTSCFASKYWYILL